jgi:hypothetical protein
MRASICSGRAIVRACGRGTSLAAQSCEAGSTVWVGDQDKAQASRSLKVVQPVGRGCVALRACFSV